jgi:uncharacterized protein
MPPLRPPLRLVLDTNVALDLLHWHSELVTPLRRSLRDGHALWLTDAACSAEFMRVLDYPEFKLDLAGRIALGEEYQRLTRTLPPEELAPLAALPKCRDRDDQKFLELAVASQADVLRTRDKALLKLARRVHQVAPQLVIATPLVELPRILSSAREDALQTAP